MRIGLATEEYALTFKFW